MEDQAEEQLPFTYAEPSQPTAAQKIGLALFILSCLIAIVIAAQQ